MTAILRNNAIFSSHGVGGAALRKGGSGRSPRNANAKKVGPKFRYSEDPAAELMPAAEFLGQEPDFAAIVEDFRDSPFDPARRKILGRLMGMFAMDYQGARAEERRFLKRLLLARNAREGYIANRALHLGGAPHAIRRTLALGVAEARFATGPISGFLGATQARVAATTFRMLGPTSRETIWNLLTLAGTDDSGGAVPGADRILERALILKALAARRHLLGPWSKQGPRCIDEVIQFAKQLRGASRETLAARTTLFPGDPDRPSPNLRNYSSTATLAMYMARGDADPIFAWAEHGFKRDRVQPQNKPTWEEDTLPDLDRSPLLDRPRLHQALAELRIQHDLPISDSARQIVVDYLGGRTLSEEQQQIKNETLAIFTSHGFDISRTAAIDAIHQDARGIYKFDLARAFGDLLSRFTGATYIRRIFSDQLNAGNDPLGQIAAALERGMAVPMLINDIRLDSQRGFAIVDRQDSDDRATLTLHEPNDEVDKRIDEKALLGTLLPTEFGRKARADSYLAPAALDLFLPPFGLPFPQLGIEDRL